MISSLYHRSTFLIKAFIRKIPHYHPLLVTYEKIRFYTLILIVKDYTIQVYINTQNTSLRPSVWGAGCNWQSTFDIMKQIFNWLILMIQLGLNNIISSLLEKFCIWDLVLMVCGCYLSSTNSEAVLPFFLKSRSSDLKGFKEYFCL